MSILESSQEPFIQKVQTDEHFLTVSLSDGRSLSAPLEWFPRLLKADEEQKRDWELIAGGEGIHWPQIDEDLSLNGLLAGISAPEVRPRHQTDRDVLDAAEYLFAKSLREMAQRLQEDRKQVADLQRNLDFKARSRLQRYVDGFDRTERLVEEIRERHAAEVLA